MNHGFADADEDREGKVNRSRIKIGGTLFTPQFDYYTEHAIPSSTLLAFLFSYKLDDVPINVRIGE